MNSYDMKAPPIETDTTLEVVLELLEKYNSVVLSIVRASALHFGYSCHRWLIEDSIEFKVFSQNANKKIDSQEIFSGESIY